MTPIPAHEGFQPKSYLPALTTQPKPDGISVDSRRRHTDQSFSTEDSFSAGPMAEDQGTSEETLLSDRRRKRMMGQAPSFRKGSRAENQGFEFTSQTDPAFVASVYQHNKDPEQVRSFLGSGIDVVG